MPAVDSPMPKPCVHSFAPHGRARLLCPGCPVRGQGRGNMNPVRIWDVIVIGGGFAGLSAADCFDAGENKPDSFGQNSFGTRSFECPEGSTNFKSSDG